MTQKEFEIIFSTIRSRLIALVGRFGKATATILDADDIVQEAFIALWKLSANNYKIQNVEALLIKITKNICISQLRRQKIKMEPFADDIIASELASDETDRMDEATIKAKLYQALSPTEMEYMLMKTDEGLSLDEMSQKTGSSKNSIKVTLSKAKKKLTKLFYDTYGKE